MNRKGFTLIELLAVILILSGMSIISFVGITSYQETQKDRQSERDKSMIENKAKVYCSLTECSDDEVQVQELIDYGALKLANNDLNCCWVTSDEKGNFKLAEGCTCGN